ncbi:MAG: metallophosphoesterase family protein [Longimicrobiales bacterium]
MPRSGPPPPALVEGPRVRFLDPPAGLANRDSVRIVLVGDTGERSPERDQVLSAIAAEEKDLIAVLGDLVYPRAPRCPDGTLTDEARSVLDDRIGTPLGGLGAPVFLIPGNHDVVRRTRLWTSRELDPAMEACLLAYAKATPDDEIYQPSRHYAFQAGPVALAFVSSSGTFLDGEAADMTATVFERESGDWNLLLAHDVYRTYYDKETERHLRDWVAEAELAPDVVGSGHAHLLQMGVYDGVLAITSGGGSKKRNQPRCDRGFLDQGYCRTGQLFGSRRSFGYAVLDIAPDEALVTFKDQRGDTLWSCRVRQRGQCDLERQP